MDGHSGLENRRVNEGISDNFLLILSYLKESNDTGRFIIHAASRSSIFRKSKNLRFLNSIGFESYRGQCQFFDKGCYYREIVYLLDFERIKEHDEKTILIANTHNILPIAERENLENFTKPVIDFLRPFPILLMTSYDLYQMVKDLLNGSKSRNALIKLLYKTEGVLSYE